MIAVLRNRWFTFRHGWFWFHIERHLTADAWRWRFAKMVPRSIALFVFVRVYGMGESTAVYRVDSASGRMERVVEGLGINVVGAGVSTCAPTAR